MREHRYAFLFYLFILFLCDDRQKNCALAFLPTANNNHNYIAADLTFNAKQQSRSFQRRTKSFLDLAEGNYETILNRFDRRLLLSTILNSIVLNQVVFPTEHALAESNGMDFTDAEKNLCNDGTIVAESQVPGAYQQVCMSLPERSLTLKSTGEELVVLQGTRNSGNGLVTGRTGVAVWNSCLLLTRLLDQLGSKIFQGKTVLELGCGTGLASLAAAKLGAAKVYATDGNEEVVGLARANIERNGLSSIIEASKLQWGLLDASDFYDTADIIIGSDLTYNSGTWRALAETLSSTLKPGGIFLYLSLGHSGFNISGELDGFLTVTQNMGLIELKETPAQWPGKVSTGYLTTLLQNSLTDDEKKVVTGTGGVRVLLIQRK